MIMGATTLLIGATAFIPMYHTPGTPPPCALRTSRILAYVGPEDSETGLQNNPLLYVKTKGGLSYKDVERGNGESLSDDAIVELQYTASLISTGEVVEKTREGRPLTFQLGKGKAGTTQLWSCSTPPASFLPARSSRRRARVGLSPSSSAKARRTSSRRPSRAWRSA